MTLCNKDEPLARIAKRRFYKNGEQMFSESVIGVRFLAALILTRSLFDVTVLWAINGAKKIH